MRGIFLLLLTTTVSQTSVTSQEYQVSDAVYIFARDLYGKIQADHPKNFVFSPLSLHENLSLLYQGAVETTKELLRKALYISNVTSLVADQYQIILDHLFIQNVYLPNKIYIELRKNVKPEYKTLLQQKFHSTVIPFAQNASTELFADRINFWIKFNTGGRVKNIVSPENISNTDEAISASAFYIKGAWKTPFIVSDSKSQIFHVSKEEPTSVRMMHTRGEFLYREDDKIQASILSLPLLLNLPYPISDEFDVTIILPNEGSGIEDLERNLISYDLFDICKESKPTAVDVFVPYFRVETNLNSLKEYLKNLNLGELFTDEAHFDKMVTNSTLKINHILHKAIFEINEYGTDEVARASLNVTTKEESTSPAETPSQPESKTFLADRPFLVLVKINVTGPLLLYGRVLSPDIFVEL